MDNSFLNEIKKEFETLEKNNAFRTLKKITSPCSSHITINNKKTLNFCSNNYLGFTTNPDVIDYSIKILKEYGTGAGASRLIAGNLSPHFVLEQKLAEFLGTEDTLVFSSGYQANIGVITALAGHNDALFCDRLCHASIIDGAMLSKAKLFRYPHKDCQTLKKLLDKHKNTYKHKIIITESVFSMDGDIAPLLELVKIAKKFNCLLIIDEAHAIGVIGENGRGVYELFGIKLDDSLLIIGTLGKALGSAGAFVACNQTLKNYFINKSRSFIFTTAPTPVSMATAIKSIELIKSSTESRKNLLDNAQKFRTELKTLGFDCLESETQIIPVIIGDNKKTVLFSKLLLEKGIYILGIRPPTVPLNTARLRISIMATHTKDEIKECINALKSIGKELEII
ncbi:MAG: 8-amino-7-oxononanoate synthase [Candidatus Firestonebacteria bacterium]|nr:8-amino-7-oxononanoate synthase [Candidatus Firestonebacteria bacterium]